ncbi:MAG: hypothetical protein FOGNACKC_00085 [Anaerolineae bacterium]|nr:hypothetical protein [Anaerolineae bacterium]
MIRSVQLFLLRSREALSRDPLFKRLLRNSGWLLGANTSTALFGFLQGIIVARALGVEKLGVLTLVMSYVTLINQLVTSRVWETAIRYATLYIEQKNFTHATAVIKLCYVVDSITGILAFILVFLSAETAARLFIKDTTATSMLHLYGLFILISIPVDTSSALLRIGNRFRWLSYQETGVAVAKLILASIALFFGMGVTGVLGAYLIAAWLGLLALLFFSYTTFTELQLVRWQHAPLLLLRNDLGQIGRFMLTTNGGALLKLLQLNADTLLVGYWLSPYQVGYLRVARSMAELVNFPVAPFYAASYPEFARLWHQKNIQSLQNLVRKSTFVMGGIGLAGFLIILLNGEWLVRLTVGQEYLPTLPVLYWLAFGMAIAVSFSFGHPLLLAVGKATFSFLAMLAGVTVQLLLLIYLIPRYGVVAAGISFAGFYFVWTIIVLFMIRKIE